MVEKLVAQQGAAEVVTTAETTTAVAEKTVFLGMTGGQLIAFGVGVVAGAAICYAGYQYYKKTKTDPTTMATATPVSNTSLFVQRKSLKNVKELIARKEYVPTLDAENLNNWFRNNRVEISDAKLMIAFPNDKVLNAVGYSMDDDKSVDLDKLVVQSVYNSKNGAVYKLRCIGYDNIDSQLQARLLENDGLVILDY